MLTDQIENASERKEEIKTQLKSLKENSWRIDSLYAFNNSFAKGNEVQSAIGQGFIYSFTSYAEEKIKTITLATVENKINQIKNKFNKYQKTANKIGVALNPAYGKLYIALAEVEANLKDLKKQENKNIKEEKKRIKEEEQLLKEAEKERKRLEEEKEAMNTAFNSILSEEERQEIKQRMAEIDKRIASVDYRCTHQKSGWVYIISSPALEGMVKIGSSRRLNPTLRVKELSSSSIPFPFHSHGFVFSEDCFELEASLHKHFEKYRVHPDREFFYLDPKEVIEVVKNKYKLEVHFELEEN